MTDLFFETKLFNELNSSELYKLLQLRSMIFVVEQNCIYQDIDDKDLSSIHILVYYKNKLIGYARCCPPGLSYPEASSIGRVLIHPEYRSNKWAYVLMKKSIAICEKHFTNYKIYISAQLYLQKFYEKCGFEGISDVYKEDGIPHIKMALNRLNKHLTLN
jgi:ElaA protein